MEKFHRAALAAFGTIDSIAHGFAQMASLGEDRVRLDPPRSDAEALKGDWVKVGQDMARGIDKARDRGKAA